MAEVSVQEKQFELLLAELSRIGSELELIRRKLDKLDVLDAAIPEIARVGHSLESLAFAALGREGPRLRRA